MPNLRSFDSSRTKSKNHDSGSMGGKKRRPRRMVQKGAHDDSNWLISYADIMTLLCIFYIMMFSMAKVNTAEFEKVKEKVAEHFKADYVSPTTSLDQSIKKVIEESGLEKHATVTRDGVSVAVAFHSTVFFNSLSADLLAPGQSVLQKLVAELSEKEKQSGKPFKIVVEGHTDSQAIVQGPFPSNWELSSARATRVVRLFLEHGYSPHNLLAIGYADTHPIAESHHSDGSWNSEALAKNRRVVLRVMLPEVDAIPWSSDGRAPASEAANR